LNNAEGVGAEENEGGHAKTLVVEEATLVVCPMSVITSWEAQAKQHTQVGAVEVTILHPSRGFATLVSRRGHSASGPRASSSHEGEGRGGCKAQQVVLVSYESLRSMYRKFLVLKNSSECNSSTATAAAGGIEKAEEVETEHVREDRVEDRENSQEDGRRRGDKHNAKRNAKRNAAAATGVNQLKAQTRIETQTQTLEAIFGGRWWRIVLDEAHVIKNRHSLNYRACVALAATHRWCLTGTPLQNSADDVQPLMAFLRLEPLNHHAVWQRYIGKPIRVGDPLGLARLRVAMKAVSLRRSRAVIATSLPPITVLTHTVRMEGAERCVYDVLFASARAAFMALDAHGDSAVMQQYTSVLECLLRLRQACSSASIVPAARLARARQVLQLLTGSDDPHAPPPPPLATGATATKYPVVKAELTAEEAAKILKTLTALQEAENALEGVYWGVSGAGERGVGRLCCVCERFV
jgi:SWI/SNF-related matrix-associated actin-dependent regulator of chromatin subfamily A3